jgi:GGDEF domain-containing protein
MAIAGPRRRRSDARATAPPAFGPTPCGIGPPDPTGVARSVALALEAARRHRRPLTVVVVDVPEPSDVDALARVAALVRTTVRDTDGLWRDGPGSLVLVLVDADGPNSEPALARLRLRLRREGFGAVRMGRASPAPGIGADDLLELARGDRRPVARPQRPA